jgi:hypothetical protein
VEEADIMPVNKLVFFSAHRARLALNCNIGSSDIQIPEFRKKTGQTTTFKFPSKQIDPGR